MYFHWCAWQVLGAWHPNAQWMALLLMGLRPLESLGLVDVLTLQQHCWLFKVKVAQWTGFLWVWIVSDWAWVVTWKSLVTCLLIEANWLLILAIAGVNLSSYFMPGGAKESTCSGMLIKSGLGLKCLLTVLMRFARKLSWHVLLVVMRFGMPLAIGIACAWMNECVNEWMIRLS